MKIKLFGILAIIIVALTITALSVSNIRLRKEKERYENLYRHTFREYIYLKINCALNEQRNDDKEKD